MQRVWSLTPGRAASVIFVQCSVTQRRILYLLPSYQLDLHFYIYVCLFHACSDWAPSLWLETFDELLYEDNELDYGDQWTLNFNYSQTDTVTKEERKKGWKVYCHCAYGKYVSLYFLKVSGYMTLNYIQY